MKRTLSACSCAAFLLCFVPARADVVTLSAEKIGTLSLTIPIDRYDIWPWTGNPDHLCVFDTTSQKTWVTVNGTDRHDCTNCSGDNYNDFGCEISGIRYGDNVKVTVHNPENKSISQRVVFYETGHFNTSRIVGETTFEKVPAKLTVAALVNNNISTSLKGTISKSVGLSFGSPTALTLGGILTFTPDQKYSEGGKIKSGSDVVQYLISGATWDGKSWSAQDVKTDIVFNPNHLKLSPGKYSGSLEAKISIP